MGLGLTPSPGATASYLTAMAAANARVGAVHARVVEHPNAQDVATLRRWSEAGTAYGAQDHLYSGWSHAAALIIGDVPSATERRLAAMTPGIGWRHLTRSFLVFLGNPRSYRRTD